MYEFVYRPLIAVKGEYDRFVCRKKFYEFGLSHAVRMLIRRKQASSGRPR